MTEKKQLNVINDIPQKDADTIEERLLLGYLGQEAKRLEYGKLTVEFIFRAGKIDRATFTEPSKIINIGRRAGPGAL